MKKFTLRYEEDTKEMLEFLQEHWTDEKWNWKKSKNEVITLAIGEAYMKRQPKKKGKKK